MKPVIFGLSGPKLTSDERALFAEVDPVGYTFFKRNISDREQIRALTDSLRSIHGRDDVLIFIDQCNRLCGLISRRARRLMRFMTFPP
jgi:beta-N-acetylhexosaminidase